MNKKELTKRIKKARVIKKDETIIQMCEGKDVLDVGCVGQDRDFNDQDWIHLKIKNVASKIIGVDINKEGIKSLQNKGFEVYHSSELEFKIERKFDIILMADVIEHVDNPISLLLFYKQFLKNHNSRVVVTTPNFLSARNFVTVFFFNYYSVNLEHTFWLCPKTMAEIASRANLKVTSFAWMKSFATYKSFTAAICSPFIKILQTVRRTFNPNMFFVLQDNEKD